MRVVVNHNGQGAWEREGGGGGSERGNEELQCSLQYAANVIQPTQALVRPPLVQDNTLESIRAKVPHALSSHRQPCMRGDEPRW